MNNYRNSLKNMHRETRFSIPFNNTSIKRRILINKLGLSQEIESAISHPSNSSQPLTINSKISKNNNKNNLSISHFKSNYIRPISPYDKAYTSDNDDNITVCNESLLSFGNRLGLRSPTPDFDDDLPTNILSPILRKGNISLMRNTHYHDSDDDDTGDVTFYDTNDHNLIDDKSFFFRKSNSINIIRKAKSLDIINITADFNSIKDIRDFKADFDVLNKLKNLKIDENTNHLIEKNKKKSNIISKDTISNNSNPSYNSTKNEIKDTTTKFSDDHPHTLSSNNNNSDNENSSDINDSNDDVNCETYKEQELNKLKEKDESNMKDVTNDDNKSSFSTSISTLTLNNNIGLTQQYMEPDENELFEEEIIPIEEKRNNYNSLLVKSSEQSISISQPSSIEQSTQQSSEQSISISQASSSIEQSTQRSSEAKEIKEIENKKEVNSDLSSTSTNSLEFSNSPSTAEQMFLQFVAMDEQEKTLLQQAIIDQTTQRINEQQEEANRLTNKISQQKAKLEEHKALHRQLSRELELKRRQSAELRLKLSSQFERNKKQRKELDYYKEMNSKFMEENRLLQQQIRELTKRKFSKLN
eukprot:jgi/Orpsp1_1/1191038/evm.model.d7180000083074.1